MRRIVVMILVLTSTAASAATNSGTVHVTGNLLSSSCTVTGGTDLTFNLDAVTKADFPDQSSTAGRQEQSIELICDADTVINMTVDADTDATDNTIIKNTGSAQGVGLQLLDVSNSNTPIKMGRRWVVITDSTQVETIPLAAQYIRIGALESGSVKANATYTLDYE
ncbi:fimbrial protein [Citrobacter werkmanii]|uniref:fimbrial protein n=1 Tax=Citrobacter werkmanii TaxID=67827 RepID=UPI0037CA0751